MYVRTPNGIRTRAATLKGWCPRPLDDGGRAPHPVESTETLAAARRRSTSGCIRADGVSAVSVASPDSARTDGVEHPRQVAVEVVLGGSSRSLGRRRSSSSSLTSSTVPSTRRTLLTACTNASSSLLVERRPCGPAARAPPRRVSMAAEPAGDQLVAHQPLVLGLRARGRRGGRPGTAGATRVGGRRGRSAASRSSSSRRGDQRPLVGAEVQHVAVAGARDDRRVADHRAHSSCSSVAHRPCSWSRNTCISACSRVPLATTARPFWCTSSISAVAFSRA